MKRQEVIAEIEAELEAAYAKHGRKPWSRHEFHSILLEEMDEMWDDIKANAPAAQLEKEIRQIGAVVIRYLETK